MIINREREGNSLRYDSSELFFCEISSTSLRSSGDCGFHYEREREREREYIKIEEI